MKLKSYVSAIGAVAAVTLLAGCGGGDSTSAGSNNGGGNLGGGGGTRASIQGIWTGNTISNMVGLGTAVVVQYNLNGATVTGTSELMTPSGQISDGTVTGTFIGTTANLTVDYGTHGVATYTLTISGNQLNGTYTLTLNGTTIDSGSIALSKSNLTSTTNVAASYAGTWQLGGGAAQVSLYFTVTQTGDTFTIVGNSNNVVGFTGTGAVVGDTVTAHLVMSGTGNTVDITGTVNNGAIAGTTFQPASNSGTGGQVAAGTFNVAPVGISTK